LGTTKQTGSPGSNKTGLLTTGSVPGHGRGLTNVLVVTTTVRVIHGVHGNTTGLGPRVALNSELVLGARSLEQRLVGTTTTGNDTNHTTRGVLHNLLGTGGQLDTGLAVLGVLANDGDVVTGGTTESTTVTRLLLDVGDDGTFGDGGEREDVADGQSGVLSGVDELASVHALVGNEGLGDLLELVGVTELDLGEGSTTAGIVDDLLHDTTSVSMTLSVVERTELGGSLVETGVGREDGSTSLSLIADHTTHGDFLSEDLNVSITKKSA
jgi:hypothetical protein